MQDEHLKVGLRAMSTHSNWNSDYGGGFAKITDIERDDDGKVIRVRFQGRGWWSHGWDGGNIKLSNAKRR